MPPRTKNSLDSFIIRHLQANDYLSLIDIAKRLSPEIFTTEDVASRQAFLEELHALCSRLVASEVLATAYSPSDGDLVYFNREVFQGNPGDAGAESANPGTTTAPGELPAVFHFRGKRFQAPVTDSDAVAGDSSDSLSTTNTRYAVFFKLGTVLRPSCEEVLRRLAPVAARASQVHVMGRTSPLVGPPEMNRILASQRAAIVANRLVDLGVDRFRIELSLQEQDEQELMPGVFAIDPPNSASAQMRRVDINLNIA